MRRAALTLHHRACPTKIQGTQEDANTYAGKLSGVPWAKPPFTIVKTSITPSLANGPFVMDGMDAYTVHNSNLGSLAPPEIVK